MEMRCVGKGIYHAGPLGGIENPGDFGWRLDVVGGVLEVQIALYCPRHGVCFQNVHEGPAGDFPRGRFWHWDGNWDKPTITPSLGCEIVAVTTSLGIRTSRCGSHMTIANGHIEGISNWAAQDAATTVKGE